MAEIVTLPKLGLSDYGEVVAWEVAVGDRVEAGDVLAVIESEKASAELESPAAGVLLATYVDAGEEIAIEPGRPMGAVGKAGETAPTEAEATGETAPTEAEATGETAPTEAEATGEATRTEAETPGETAADDRTAEAAAASGDGAPSDAPSAVERVSESDADESAAEEGIVATPRARKLAREEDVDVATVEGTGPQGAVTESDVERHLGEAGREGREVGQGREGERESEGERGREREHAREGGGDGEAGGSEAVGEGEASGSEAVPEKVSPRARRVAEERGVSLAGIEGTGPQGSVVERDVRTRAAGDGQRTATAGTTADGLSVRETRQLSGTRATIAERLSASAREKPHVTGTREIAIEQLERVRDRLSERGLEVSLADLVLHFVGETLEDLPAFNAHFEDGEHRLIEDVNVGYAVDGPRGLVVPVVEDVSGRSLEAVADRRRELVDRVLDDEFDAADLQGGTFTVTNVGALGMDVSASIIDPPQVAILAVGRAKPTPVERDGEVEFERAMTFSLTIDHRVLDGADSGAFLERLAEYIEFPGSALAAVR